MLGAMSARSNNPSLRRRVRFRDQGLRRVTTATRVLVAGSLAASGAFAALAAWAQPARARATRATVPAGRLAPLRSPRRARTRAPSPAPTAPRRISDDGGTQHLAPPVTAPSPSYSYAPAPVVVSGAS